MGSLYSARDQLAFVQWSLSTRDKLKSGSLVPYTVEPLYKGQVGSFVPYTVEPLYKGQDGVLIQCKGPVSFCTVEPLYKGQVGYTMVPHNKGQVGEGPFVPCPLSRGGITVAKWRFQGAIDSSVRPQMWSCHISNVYGVFW